LVLKMSGFMVLTATGPTEAISVMSQHAIRKIDIAILDYNMPVMNGCVLAEYLRTRYPDLKIVLHSGAVDIPENEMDSIDVFAPKRDGIACLLHELSVLAESSASLATDGLAPKSSLLRAPGRF
jgi:DNA-binding NarL/FixJ family response regulator